MVQLEHKVVVVLLEAHNAHFRGLLIRSVHKERQDVVESGVRD